MSVTKIRASLIFWAVLFCFETFAAVISIVGESPVWWSSLLVLGATCCGGLTIQRLSMLNKATRS